MVLSPMNGYDFLMSPLSWSHLSWLMNMERASVSKISPLILGEVMPRERLFALLDQKPPTNAFWVSGPGGSGKTTFVASYLQERKKTASGTRLMPWMATSPLFFIISARLQHP